MATDTQRQAIELIFLQSATKYLDAIDALEKIDGNLKTELRNHCRQYKVHPESLTRLAIGPGRHVDKKKLGKKINEATEAGIKALTQAVDTSSQPINFEFLKGLVIAFKDSLAIAVGRYILETPSNPGSRIPSPKGSDPSESEEANSEEEHEEPSGKKGKDSDSENSEGRNEKEILDKNKEGEGGDKDSPSPIPPDKGSTSRKSSDSWEFIKDLEKDAESKSDDEETKTIKEKRNTESPISDIYLEVNSSPEPSVVVDTSKNLRKKHIQALELELSQTRESNKALKEHASASQSQREEDERVHTKLKDEITELNRKLSAHQNELQTQTLALTQAQAQLDAERRSLAQAQGELKEKDAALKSAGAELKETHEALAQAQGELKETHEALTRTHAELKLKTEAQQTVQAELQAKHSLLEKTQNEVKSLKETKTNEASTATPVVPESAPESNTNHQLEVQQLRQTLEQAKKDNHAITHAYNAVVTSHNPSQDAGNRAQCERSRRRLPNN